MNLRGQIQGLRGPERADFRLEMADFRLESADSRPEKADSRPEKADFIPKHESLKFIYLPIMNSPIFPIPDDIYFT